MTYKSTNRILFQAIETGKLVRREPFRRLSASVRSLYVTPDVAAGLDGNDKSLAHLPMQEMEKLIAVYIAGHTSISVSMSGDNGKKPDFERLQNLLEVWAICARRPRQFQVRLFGRFIAPGVFVGLSLHDRYVLGTRKSYHRCASQVPSLWAAALGNASPLTATEASGYLGGECRDVDQL